MDEVTELENVEGGLWEPVRGRLWVRRAWRRVLRTDKSQVISRERKER